MSTSLREKNQGHNLDEFIKSPTPSLRGAKRRGNLMNFRRVTRLPLGRELGAERLRGVYPEPVEGLAMTKSLFSDFLRCFALGAKGGRGCG